MTSNHTRDALAARDLWKAQTFARAARLRALHVRRYPTAYEPDTAGLADANRTRALSAATSLTVAAHGADRPRIAETTRRYDVDDRLARDLEREADRILRNAGYTVDAVDVVDTFTRVPTVRPDRVAFRGTVRYKVPARHRSERSTSLTQRPSNAALRARYKARKLRKLQTRVVSPVRIFDVDAAGIATVTWLVRTEIAVSPERGRVAFVGVDAPGYRGRRYVMTGKTTAGQTPRTAGQTPRTAGRPAGSVWTIGTASVRTRWNRLKKADEALAREAAEIATAARAAILRGESLTVSGAVLEVNFDKAATTTTGQSPVTVAVLADDETTRLAVTFAVDDVVRRYALAVLATERRDATTVYNGPRG